MCKGQKSWLLSFLFLPCSLFFLFCKWYTGIRIPVEFILPGKGCRGTAGVWHSKQHTTGGGTGRSGGSQCPGVQAPGGTGVQGKGKASGGWLSSRGPWEFSCKSREHRLDSDTRLGKERIYSRMLVGPPNFRAWRAGKSHPLVLPMERRDLPKMM